MLDQTGLEHPPDATFSVSRKFTSAASECVCDMCLAGQHLHMGKQGESLGSLGKYNRVSVHGK